MIFNLKEVLLYMIKLQLTAGIHAPKLLQEPAMMPQGMKETFVRVV